ncbi:MAG: hypothetical protein ACO1N3_03845 [Gammaproteobacteria bacterium]
MLNNSKLSAGSKIPDVIFRDETVQFEMTQKVVGAPLDAAALLTYECGYDKEITFLSTTTPPQFPPMPGHYDDSYSAIIESNNLAADFNFKRCNNYWGTMNESVWTFRSIDHS